jgi:thioredoxin 2
VSTVFSVLRACTKCGAANRVPARHLASRGKCGKCQAALPPLDTPLDVSAAEFDEINRESQVPILVDFWASWCPPCRMVAPEVKKLAASQTGKLVVLKVDTEANPQVASRFAVQSIPNFIILRGGKLLAQRPGYAPEQELAAWVRSVA